MCVHCGKEYVGKLRFCSLECLHAKAKYKASGSYNKKRVILNYLIKHPELSLRYIAKLFNVSKSVTERLSLFTDRCREVIKCNTRYFENIDTEYKAYWLGFLYADGSVYKSKSNSCVIEVSLKKDDYTHLEKFKKCLNSDGKIKYRNIQLNDKTYEACRFNICSFDMYKDLVSKGCVEKKSLILKFPDKKIFKNNLLVRHFIRGYVDGDGCLGRYTSEKISCYYPLINVLGTEHMINGIFEYLTENFIDYGVKNTLSTGNIHYFSKSWSKAFNIIDFLYKDSNISLDRKHDIYNNMLQDVLWSTKKLVAGNK